MNYSIVIPVYRRLKIIHQCLNSIKLQELKPLEVIFVDNNNDEYESEKLQYLVDNFIEVSKISSYLIKSPKNSGAIARNIGANFAKGDFIAFLDSDVILDANYYKILSKYFLQNESLIAIQGLDRSLIEYQRSLKKYRLLKKIFFLLEQFFETSFLINKSTSYVSPSMAVAHPNALSDFEVSSEWISTCAGVFKKEIFQNYSFPNQFVTYSNNEYLIFSHKLFKDNLGLMLYTSRAKYRDIQTQSGRVKMIPLMYQIQTYDWFIFFKLFKCDFKNIFIFIKSRIGHLFYNLARTILKKNISFKNVFHSIFSVFYPIFHMKSILKNDLSFYEKDFM